VKEDSLLENVLLMFQLNAFSESHYWGNVCPDDNWNILLKCQQKLSDIKLVTENLLSVSLWAWSTAVVCYVTVYRLTYSSVSFVIVWHCVGLTLIAMLSCTLHAHTWK